MIALTSRLDLRPAWNRFQAFVLEAETRAQQVLEEACRRHAPPSGEAFAGAFDGRWLSCHRFSARRWLLCLKAFELSLDARALAALSGLPRATAHRALTTIRAALACRDPAWTPVALACLRGRPPERATVTLAGRSVVLDAHGRVPQPLRAALAARRGVDARYLPLYARELELRLSCAPGELFDLALDAVARPLPAGAPCGRLLRRRIA